MPQMIPLHMVPRGHVRPRWGRVAVVLGLALSLGVATKVSAATTWTVCASGCDYTGIKAAIAASTTLDGDTPALAAGTYTEAGVTVNKSLTLQGEDAATTIVQAAGTPDTASTRVFTIPSGVTETLQALTIRYGGTTGNGGGLYNAGTLILTHSTISSNAARDGGGLLTVGTLTLTHSTISGNAATSFGGGLYNEGTLTLTNSIVGKNSTGGDCRNIYSNGSITSTGYNLDSDGSCQLTAATDRPGVDPFLGTLQDNGGPTLTYALLPGSPAIDTIPWGTNSCGTTRYSDQRWQARPQPEGGACDIGAYEVVMAGQALGGWGTGIIPRTVGCQNVTTGQAVTLSAPTLPWDCEAAGLVVTPGDQVVLRMRGPVKTGATDVGGAVVGMVPSSGGCTNLTTGQQVTFQHMQGATAASCVAVGLVGIRRMPSRYTCGGLRSDQRRPSNTLEETRRGIAARVSSLAPGGSPRACPSSLADIATLCSRNRPAQTFVR